VRRLLLLAACCTLPAWADDVPAFDRPGIAFAPAVLPAGSMDWEQGLPDLTRDSSDGVTTTLYSADTLVRAALRDNLELQLGMALANRQVTSDTAGEHRSDGTGDSSIGLKMSVPTGLPAWTAAVLGRVTAASGDAAFSAGTTQYTLGGSLGGALSDRLGLGLFMQVLRSGGQYDWTASPSLSCALSERWSAFVEAGSTHTAGSGNSHVAGGGLTWMVLPEIQLDLYADRGLTRASPDLQAGFGVSVFFR
jgi:hypothetical protein